jgi:hypothetical protein
VLLSKRDTLSKLLVREVIRSGSQAILLATKKNGIGTVKYGDFEFLKASSGS